MSAVFERYLWRQVGNLELLVSPAGRVLARVERSGHWWAIYRRHETTPFAYRVSYDAAIAAAEALQEGV